MPPAQPIDVAAALIFRDGRVLLTRRRPEDRLGGLWEFPGGKREGSETSAECLQRELGEELGVETEVGELVESITHAYPDQTVRLEFFRCRLLAGEPATLGCQALAWVSPAELASYRLPEADARLLTRLRNSPELWR
jgi:mutator protein MutT